MILYAPYLKTKTLEQQKYFNLSPVQYVLQESAESLTALRADTLFFAFSKTTTLPTFESLRL